MADLNGEKSTGGNLNGVLSPVHPVYKIDETLTKGGYAADAKATGDALAGKAPASHVTDKNNPHGVTPAQIGAVPTADGTMDGSLTIKDGLMFWKDNEGGNIRIYPPASNTASDYWDIDCYDGGMRIFAYKKSTNVTGGPDYVFPLRLDTDGSIRVGNTEKTRENLGVAPAGYGLGGNAKFLNISSIGELDNIKENGWYSFNLPPQQVANVLMDYAHMRVDGLDNGSARQTIYILNPYGTILHRQLLGGVWREFECKNPPMILGVEYRTTERFNGKVVYTQAFNAGAMVNNAYVSYPINTEQKYIIRGHGFLSDGTNLPAIPNNPTDEYYAAVDFSVWEMWMRCNSVHAGKTVLAQIWYTKETIL